MKTVKGVINKRPVISGGLDLFTEGGPSLTHLSFVGDNFPLNHEHQTPVSKKHTCFIY